jgi:hypothetical protein
MSNPNNRWWQVIGICVCAALVLNACGQAGVPLQITDVSVSPEPIVGRTVTLTVEIMSTHDEPDVTFTIDTLEEWGTKLHLVSGEPEWAGSLTANQPQSFQFSVCVWEEGTWPIELSAVSRLHDANNNIWHAFEGIHLESSINSGRLIRGSEFRITGEATPIPHPVTVSPECSGQVG